MLVLIKINPGDIKVPIVKQTYNKQPNSKWKHMSSSCFLKENISCHDSCPISLALHVEWQPFVRQHSIQEPDVKTDCYLHPTLSGFAIYSNYYSSCFIEATFQIKRGCGCGHPLTNLKAMKKQLRIIVIKHVIHSRGLKCCRFKLSFKMTTFNIDKFPSGYLCTMLNASSDICFQNNWALQHML